MFARTRWTSGRSLGATVLWLVVGASSAAHAQRPLTAEPLRIVRVEPAGVATPSSVISVAFSRAVVESVGDSAVPLPRVVLREVRGAIGDAQRAPVDSVHVRLEWRDPVTLRIIPLQPLRPGATYSVRVLAPLVAFDGARLPTNYTTEIRVRPATVLAVEPAHDPARLTALHPTGKVRVLVSSAVDEAQWNERVSLQVMDSAGCASALIPFRIVQQRIPAAHEFYSVSRDVFARSGRVDTLARVLQYEPTDAIPPSCDAIIRMPSVNSSEASPERSRYRVRTRANFSFVSWAPCDTLVCADPRAIAFGLTATVDPQQLRNALRLEPARSFSIERGSNSFGWRLVGDFAPGTLVRLHIDSTLRDSDGRALMGARAFDLRIPDRRPGAALPDEGYVVLPRDTRTLRVYSVNAERVMLEAIRATESRFLLGLVQRPPILRSSQLPDTIRRIVSVDAAKNAEAMTEIELPSEVLEDDAAWLVRASVHTLRRDVMPPPTGAFVERDLLNISNPWLLPPLLLRRSNLALHLLAIGLPSAAFVTDVRTGRPVVGALVHLADSTGAPVLSATTDRAGVARLVLPSVGADGVDAATAQERWEALRSRVSLASASHSNDTLWLPLRMQSTAGLPTPLQAGAERERGYANPQSAYRRGHGYTDRPIYRPGEWVYFSASVHELMAAGWRPPGYDSLRVTLTGGDSDDATFVRTLSLSDVGTIADSMRLPDDAKVGRYSLSSSLYRNGAWKSVSAWTFSVAEYRAPEFLLSLRSDSSDTQQRDTAVFDLAARYVFDAPMSGASVRWTASLWSRYGAEALPILPDGFWIGDWSPWDLGLIRRSVRPQGRAGTDSLPAVGVLRLAVPMPTDSLFAPTNVRLEVTVADVNRQEVRANAHAVHHPSSFYLAMHRSVRVGRAGDSIAVGVMAVTSTGQLVANVPVDVALVRWRRTTQVDRAARDSVPIDTLWRTAFRTRDSLHSLPVPIDSVGIYELVMQTRDNRGRRVRTSIDLRADSANPVASRVPDSLRYVHVRLLRDSVRVGDAARVAFDSPFDDAEAWITVERAGVMWQDRRRVRRGTTELAIPVLGPFAPNALVGVMLVARERAIDMERLDERTQVGYAYLAVHEDDVVLRSEITTHHSPYRPGDTAKLSVRVSDSRDAPVSARVTVWAVDEGVLSLYPVRFVDPRLPLLAWSWPAMTMRSSLAFLPTAARRDLALERLRLPWFSLSARSTDRLFLRNVLGGVALSGTRAAPGIETVREDFRSTAFFVANVPTNAEGVATVRAKLPDNVTTYRLFATVADTAGRVGYAEDTLRTFLPLVVRAALPRFVRGGDSLFAGAVVTSADGIERSVRVSLSARGVRDSALRESIVVASSRSNEVRSAWTISELLRLAPDGVSQDSLSVAQFAFAAADTRDSTITAARDAVRVSLPVRQGGRPRVHGAGIRVANLANITIALPGDTDVTRSRLRLRVGSESLAFVQDAVAFVLGYRYDCTEQLSSNLQVLATALAIARRDVSVGADSMVLLDRTHQMVKMIESRALPNGAFAYWPSSQWTTPSISAYAGLALLAARDVGVAVDSSVLNMLHVYLQSAPSDSSFRGFGSATERGMLEQRRGADLLARAWYARTLGNPLLSVEQELRAHPSLLTWEDKVWLSELIHEAGDTDDARTRLLAAWKVVKPAATLVDLPVERDASEFSSRLRAPARLLSATRRILPDHELLGALEQRVLIRGRGLSGWMWNTQDFGWAVPALMESAIAARDASPLLATGVRDASVRMPGVINAMADTTLAVQDFAIRRGDSIMVTVTLQSERPTFVAVEVSQVATARPVMPDARGMSVERWYERVRDGARITQVEEGEMVRVRLRVRVPAIRDFVALEDWLPAGLEVVDPSLRTTAGLSTVSSDTDARTEAEQRSHDELDPQDRGYGRSVWDHRALRDDRVQFFARYLRPGVFEASYLARATTAGRFVRPPAQAEEMYNAGVMGRSDGGWFGVRSCVGPC